MAELGSTSQRRLTAARFVGANAFSAFAQFAVNMPEGYFGAADSITAVGVIYLGWLLVSTVAGLWGIWANKERVVFLLWLTLSLNLGIFVAPLATSPIMAAMAIIWNLVALSWILFPLRTAAGELRQWSEGREEGWLERWQRRNAPAVRHLLLSSLVLNIAVFGYRLSEQLVTFGMTLTLAVITVALSVGPLWRILRHGRWIMGLMILPILAGAFYLQNPDIFLFLISSFQLITLLVFYFQSPAVDDILDFFYEYPAVLVLATFAGLTLLGTLLLSLPAASATGQPVDALDALFTSTSASCITGLIVVDTPTAYSRFGHIVLLCLFQLGGMGILVLSTFATLLLGNKLGLRAEQAVEESLGMRGAESTYSLARFVVGSTLLIEALGATALTFAFLRLDYALPEAIWQGVFHAVSAFCHAGFALHNESMMIFQDDPIALTVITVLIVLGSVGFLAMAVGWDWLRGRRKRANLQARIIALATFILLAAGIVLFLICEWNASMAGLSWDERFFNALFQSATLRSAGFNSLDTSLFSDATIWFSIIFMIIGGAPDSTAGGIKITTLVVLLVALQGISHGRPRAMIFNRRISQTVVYRSAGIVIAYLAVFGLLLFLLLLTQPLPFEMLAFEAASASGTVGISVGATPQLNDIGKSLIIIVIFLGRVGPLALALLLGRGGVSRIDYPEEHVMVG